MKSLLTAFFALFLAFTLAPAQDGEPTNAEEAAAQKAAAAAELDAQYEAWIATLPPAQQAWERVLQGELGGFYLPIHQREKIAGKSNAWDYVEDDPSLPRVLLIGDSVSRAYTQTVRAALAGKANVHRAPANCGPTATGVKKIDLWLGDGNWDLIHFNFGIHDRNTPIADYTTRLEQLVIRMKETGASLVWAHSTPLPDLPEKDWSAASMIDRNAAATELMESHGVAVNDLFSVITPRLAEFQNPDDCHFNGPGNAYLGRAVANFIEGQLDQEKPRVWIFTDMSDSRLPGSNHRGTINDPDDISAMAGYLLMANEFDTRGIVVTSTNRPDHQTTPDQAAWANSFFGDAYRADLPGLNEHLGGFPESISFMESSIKETAEKFSPSREYRSLEDYSTVAALLEEAQSAEATLNVLCWGSLTESAIFVKHCVDTKQEDLLKRVRFIAHWTSSTFHMGTPEQPETVPNCAEDAAACRFLKDAAQQRLIQYFECGAIGQHGIVVGGPTGEAYFEPFKVSKLGRIFAEGKFVRGKVDHSDSATYWVLLGDWGVSLNDLMPDGSNPPSVEEVNEQRFHAASSRIHDELLRRSQLAGKR